MSAHQRIITVISLIILFNANILNAENIDTELIDNSIVVTGTIDKEALSKNPVLPQAYTCTLNQLVRHIEIEYGSLDEVPCQVNYKKETELPDTKSQILWSAKHNESYCENKALEFAIKLRSLGWNCRADDPEFSLTAY